MLRAGVGAADDIGTVTTGLGGDATPDGAFDHGDVVAIDGTRAATAAVTGVGGEATGRTGCTGCAACVAACMVQIRRRTSHYDRAQLFISFFIWSFLCCRRVFFRLVSEHAAGARHAHRPLSKRKADDVAQTCRVGACKHKHTTNETRTCDRAAILCGLLGPTHQEGYRVEDPPTRSETERGGEGRGRARLFFLV